MMSRRVSTLTSRRGNVMILMALWTAVLLAGVMAVSSLGSALAMRLRLEGAMTDASTVLVDSFRFAGPTRTSQSTYQTLVQSNLGTGLPFILQSFDVRPGGPKHWQIVATGYIRWPLAQVLSSAGIVLISVRTGP